MISVFLNTSFPTVRSEETTNCFKFSAFAKASSQISTTEEGIVNSAELYLLRYLYNTVFSLSNKAPFSKVKYAFAVTFSKPTK